MAANVDDLVNYWKSRIEDFNNLKDADATNFATSRKTIYDLKIEMAKEFINQLKERKGVTKSV